jgi:hypothetical protein
MGIATHSPTCRPRWLTRPTIGDDRCGPGTEFALIPLPDVVLGMIDTREAFTA